MVYISRLSVVYHNKLKTKFVVINDMTDFIDIRNGFLHLDVVPYENREEYAPYCMIFPEKDIEILPEQVDHFLIGSKHFISNGLFTAIIRGNHK